MPMCLSPTKSRPDLGCAVESVDGRTYSLLGQLSRSLVLAVSQQFDNTALIRSQASHFLDDLADESSAFAKQALSARDAWLGGDGCDLL
jgi:hypothetical protein